MTLEGTVRYVVGVLRSCNVKQLESTMPWGVTAISKAAAISRDKRDYEGKRLDKIIPPRITTCKICGGTGRNDGDVCSQCQGSGRVVIVSEITTYMVAYEPD